MKVIAPIEVTDAMLTSSVPETDYAEWSSATAYTAGQRVIRASVHKCFEALTSNTNKTPESNPTDWLDLGATNRWKMFDRKVGTRTTATTSLTVTIEPGQIVTGIAMLEVSARSVTVTMTDPTDGVVYSQTASMGTGLLAADLWHYLFDPFERRSSIVLSGMPPYWGAAIEVTLTGATGEAVECGVCVVGTMTQFAEAARFGASVGITDYSRKEADDFGNVEVIERAYSKRANWSLLIDNADVDLFQRTLSALRATPAVYIGDDRHDAMALYGFFKDFDVTISYPTHSECSVDLEGLV